MIYFCSQKNRRSLVASCPGLNGIDYVEVANDSLGCGQQLLLTFVKDARNISLAAAQVQITGGAATAQVTVVAVAPATQAAPRVITVQLSGPGDFSAYTLSLVATALNLDPPTGLDPQLSTVNFSFKAGCPTVADCVPCDCCPPVAAAALDINYLARDFGGFRQLMLDRMSVLVPGWDQTHPADMGVVLVEALAYVADHLSYQQDAVGTESYLSTARSRISLRRLAKLVDYQIDPGSNARTWIYLNTNADGLLIPAGTLLFPRIPGFATTVLPNTPQAATLLASPAGFATMDPATLWAEQNEIPLYTWGDSGCCLPSGATEATLVGNLTTLVVGSVLIFEEIVGPNTGATGDADPTHRWAVRLTGVRLSDDQGQDLRDPLNQTLITQVTWADEDALPFPLCVSSTSDSEHGSQPLYPVSVARGNIVAADHGIWRDWESLGQVPAPPLAPVTAGSCSCTCGEASSTPLPRYYPKLSQTSVTFAYPPAAPGPASLFLAPASTSSARAQPVIQVRDDLLNSWMAVDDLLSSDSTKLYYVLEIERDNSAFLRFGDGQYGAAPEQNMSFQARYRVGSGTAGNLGRDSLVHVLTGVLGIGEVRNPLPAAGGVDPETMDRIRQEAPVAFRTQLRAVTSEDYGTQAETLDGVSEAIGTFRWTGSWYTAFVSIDSGTDRGPGKSLLMTLTTRLNLLRMAGVDLEVEGAVIVGLRIEMAICVDNSFFSADVKTALMDLFTTGDLCTGGSGLLNPANFTFGQTIFTSPLIAAAQNVQGVASARITTFERMDAPSKDGVSRGYIAMGRLEIARCDNNPNRADRGTFTLRMDGGK